MEDEWKLSAKDIAEIISVSHKILNGEIDVLLGARQLAIYANNAYGAIGEPLLGILAVDSLIKHLPIEPDERKRWSPEELVEKDLEILGCRDKFKKCILDDCRELLKAIDGDKSIVAADGRALAEMRRIANELLKGQGSLIYGCRRITELRHHTDYPEDPVFMSFRGVDCQTDHLPVTDEERRKCAPEVLAELDAEIADCDRAFWPGMTIACKELLQWLAEK